MGREIFPGPIEVFFALVHHGGMKSVRGWRSFAAAALLAIVASCDTSPDSPADPPSPSKYESTALAIGDFLLGLQDDDGAIRDSPESEVANEDSNMEYALLGLAAAYRFSNVRKYLQGLERGIDWLAAREEMADRRWRGSWSYAYSSRPPYRPLPVPIAAGIEDVRGVDATSSLFVYLLYVHSRLAGSDALAFRYEKNARAALDFLIASNQRPDGSFASSWQLWEKDHRWHLWPYRYSADQADVFLGMRAGWRLYGDARFQAAASRLEALRPKYFSGPSRRYALGLDEDGDMELDMEGFNGIFPQGYLPWVFGDNREDRAAFQWLQERVGSDGRISCYSGDPLYSLSVAVYALAAAALGEGIPAKSLDWLIASNFDPLDGGVRDTAIAGSEKYSNVAGFTIMALLRFAALTPVEGQTGR